MRYLGALVAVTTLAGCNQSHEPPVGRYQMVATNNQFHEVYVLDTANGDVWACADQPNLPLSVGCGPPRSRPH
jgi:hypothetical protein